MLSRPPRCWSDALTSTEYGSMGGTDLLDPQLRFFSSQCQVPELSTASHGTNDRHSTQTGRAVEIFGFLLKKGGVSMFFFLYSCLSVSLTVAPLVAAGHVDSPGNNPLVSSSQEPSFASVDDLVRLGRVRSNL